MAESNGDKAIKEVKHYLNGAWYWEKKQKILEENIEYLRSQAEKMTTKFQYVPVFGGYEDHRQDVIAKMIDKEKSTLMPLKTAKKGLKKSNFL